MATSTGTSNLTKPWAWLAALAVFGLVLASSTALYVVNSSVKLSLPWWTAVAAPFMVYALVLPLCVPRLRLGGWLIGLFTLLVLHVMIALSTAWLYATVGFISFEQALPPAVWGFPPALVLAMVGSLLMVLPFLSSLAPRAAAPRSSSAPAPPRPAAPKKLEPPAEAVPVKDRQAWARGPAGAEAAPAAAARAVGVRPATTFAAPTVAEPLHAPTSAPDEYTHAPVEYSHPSVESRRPPAESHHPVEELSEVPPAEPAVHAAPLTGVNGAAPDAALDAEAPAAVPDFRQALSELFGAPAAPSGSDKVLDAPDEPAAAALVAPDELVAAEPPPAEPPVVEPGPAEGVVRIPFERVIGQLPPGAFRVPLGQVGARLREAEMLVVPQALIVPQLGEGVVQVAWEVVAEQFPPTVFAVAPGEVGERIVNGRLLLPLDEIVRQLPPELFAASIGRGPVEVPGIEGFPAPFKPPGWEERPAVEAPARRASEPMSIEVPDAAEVARDLALTPPELEVRVPDAPVEEIEPVSPPSAPELAAASLLEEARPVESAEPPQNVVEIEEVAEVLDLDSLLESSPVDKAPELGAAALLEPPTGQAPPEALTRYDSAPTELQAPDELVATEPPPAEPPVGEPGLAEGVVRIPFERVIGQLPPGAFRVPLVQVGARLREAEMLVVPQALIVPQLGEGVVQVAWEVVAEQFPPTVFAVAPGEVG
ncbi:MAG TPA: hypothetical protein VFF12_12100, partial [Myxococcaceae bacterium]|nr:hypothetical protein [Myxococcaceae bacterium]